MSNYLTLQNRNIGTAKRNFGKNNHLTAPGEWLNAARLFDPLKADSTYISIGNATIRLIKEHVLPGYSHALQEIDVEQLLAVVPVEDLIGIKWIVQIQPTHKLELLGSRWACYYQEIKIGRSSGSLIALYATNPGQKIHWDTHLTPFNELELTKLTNEGHEISRDKNGYVITLSTESARNTQRRSLVHEIGHHVDTLHNADAASKPWIEREKFAEQYVSKYTTSLSANSTI